MLIIVALISILVQMAVPNYKDRMIKAHRLGAKTTLMQAQISLEDCYLFEMNYQACSLEPSSDDYKLTLLPQKHKFTLQLQAKRTALSAQDTQCYRWEVNEKNNWRVFAKDGSDQSLLCVS